MDVKYMSLIYPAGYVPPEDYDWYKDWLLSLPTEELQKKYAELSEKLDELRQKEPARKRKKREDYRGWIQSTHDRRDLLNEIADELNSRL